MIHDKILYPFLFHPMLLALLILYVWALIISILTACVTGSCAWDHGRATFPTIELPCQYVLPYWLTCWPSRSASVLSQNRLTLIPCLPIHDSRNAAFDTDFIFIGIYSDIFLIADNRRYAALAERNARGSLISSVVQFLADPHGRNTGGVLLEDEANGGSFFGIDFKAPVWACAIT